MEVLGPQIITPDASVAQRERLRIMVGAEIELNVTASWGDVYTDHNLTLYAYEDPGVPNGAVLTTQVCVCVCVCVRAYVRTYMHACLHT